MIDSSQKIERRHERWVDKIFSRTYQTTKFGWYYPNLQIWSGHFSSKKREVPSWSLRVTHQLGVLCLGRCRLLCRAKWSDRPNARKHVGQMNGLAPVCLRMWRVSSSERAKLQSHSGHVHKYGFSPVWVLWWAFRWELFVYTLLQPW